MSDRGLRFLRCHTGSPAPPQEEEHPGWASTLLLGYGPAISPAKREARMKQASQMVSSKSLKVYSFNS
jgi:hypothetical protein